MNKRQNWVEWIKDLPNWIKGALGLTTAIIGFIALILSNTYQGITVSFAVVIVALLGLSFYIAFSKKKSEIVGGGYVHRFPSHFRLGLVGVVLIPVVVIMLLTNKSSRNFAVIAFIGTATSTPTATSIPTATATPTTTLTPTIEPTDTPILPIVTPTLTPTATPLKICVELDRNQDSTVDISGGEVKFSFTTGGRFCVEVEAQVSQLSLEVKTPTFDSKNLSD